MTKSEKILDVRKPTSVRNNLRQPLPHLKTQIRIAIALFLTTLTASAASFDLQVTVGYQFGDTSSSGIYSGNPDTGFVTITNVGASSFAGTLSLDGIAGAGTDVHDTSGTITLVSGAAWTLLGGPESSNQGGFNGTVGTTQNGLELTITGTAGGLPVSFDGFDKDFHSGVFRTNPFGVTLDNYILQGGDPLGRDTGDDYETTQASAVFDITGSSIPEPASMLLFGSGLLALGWYVRRQRKDA
jgi:hypothetical protein